MSSLLKLAFMVLALMAMMSLAYGHHHRHHHTRHHRHNGGIGHLLGNIENGLHDILGLRPYRLSLTEEKESKSQAEKIK
ncbi:hypothetical protein NPIL_273711 [Nephila pilipes]|uniref:Uncharacterized protein n=1 Tax=Nephila pilipes TaxID=299642 RepID=A0A8X6UDB4_NEPPI|nr:hypothetical protein NPIL_273711 [Nephila pilipes]